MQITHTKKSNAFLLVNLSKTFENMCLEMYELDTDLFYNDETWHSYIVLEVDKKIYVSHVALVLSSADISIISPETSNFCFIKKYKYRLHFND